MPALIDMSLLPAPAVVAPADFEAILLARKARLLALYSEAERPSIALALALESEPIVKLLEESAYTELLLRARINDAARAVMLPWSTGTDLDNLAAFYDVPRLVITPADPDAIPPVPAVLESDADFRRRIQLAPAAMTNAGTRDAYLFHALSADGEVKGAHVANPEPGEVLVTVLSREGDGAASLDLQGVVYARLNADDVRALCDSLVVQSATIVDYTVEAVIDVLPGPSPAAVLEAATAALTATLADLHNLGRNITRSALFAALHQPGAQGVSLTSPAADIDIADDEAGYCTTVTVTLGSIGL
ncbi:baseplate J/gp47 family protein [Methyloversatilis sp.]|uniref:baseplate assembly protein n=1 Tax=Methyloversatilis sp. TaxID=2569862 RepID=UPI0027362F72|nr:baseplate J/gp47 family protein [Methyloversatilis sp.]MDP3579138.1 baseplate J/gp47 family protein [Methyloversatilis sp.]